MRQTVWFQAAKYRAKHAPVATGADSDVYPEGPPEPRSAAEVERARLEQVEAFEKAAAVVEGRG